MTTQTALAKFREIQAKLSALNHAMSMIYYDSVTVAPEGSAQGRGQTLGILTGMSYDLSTCEDTMEVVRELLNDLDKLDERERREVCEYNRDNEYLSSIPKEEYEAYTVLVNDAEAVWHRAKNESDFAAFAPYLEKIIDYTRRFCKYYKPSEQPYNVRLDMFERGLDMKSCDKFFAGLRERIVPLLRRVQQAQQIDDSFLYRHYPLERQREFSDYLMQVMGLDRTYCGIGETEHPFTIDFGNKDVRITTHYYEDNLASSMYSVVHEGGHALYELGGDDTYQNTILSGGVSMGIHESQSRLYENLIGRSREFIELIFPKMKELFPEQLEGVDALMMWRAVNKAEPSLIRTEADELTYCLHVMVRYELEKMLMSGELSVSELPEKWNELMKEYLGVDVPDDKHGVLQDSHWSGGSIGYFPSYALGSAYGAQILARMKQDIDVEALVASGNIAAINEWLRERIFRHACRYDPSVLLEMCCGAPFDPEYYITYLEKKYTEVYGL